MAAKTFSIGVDYGTNSVRAVVVDTATGKEWGEAVFKYPTGKDGIIVDPKDPNVARQNPRDYVKGFNVTVKAAVTAASKKSGFASERVVGIGIDTTGSTPIPVDAKGMPLAFSKAFARNPAAMGWLWKDHTSFAEAAEITEKARRAGVPYLAKCGGTYSSEWFWSKILHCERTAPEVFEAAYSWVELCDFVPAYVCDHTNPDALARSICAAGHKAMFSEEWGGLPDRKFLRKLSPGLSKLRDRLYTEALPSDEIAGMLSARTAKLVGLPSGVPVAVGGFDAHHGAVGAGIQPGTLVKIIGTSTCDMMVAPAQAKVADIPGVCGIVPGSIMPGMTGLEAGQSAVGDIVKWYVETMCPIEFADGDRYANLHKAALKLKPGESGLLALDWNNGNRCVLVDPLLSGMVVGQTLHTTAPETYRALIEGTAFGALTIINRFERYGVKVKEVINCGGLAEKSPLLMQIYADVCNRPMKISRSSQTCALGASIFGAVVGGAYRDAKAAQAKMTGVKPKVYKPIKANAEVYSELYKLYVAVHDSFGLKEAQALGHVMKRLIEIRSAARGA